MPNILLPLMPQARSLRHSMRQEALARKAKQRKTGFRLMHIANARYIAAPSLNFPDIATDCPREMRTADY